MKALWILLITFVAGSALADPADCWMQTEKDTTITFQIQERMIDYHQYEFTLTLLEDFVLPAGVMPKDQYETSNWISGDFTFDVEDHFPGRAGNATGSYLFVERAQDDGTNSLWDLRIVHYGKGEPEWFEVFAGRAHCLSE